MKRRQKTVEQWKPWGYVSKILPCFSLPSQKKKNKHVLNFRLCFVRFCRHWVRNTCVVQLGWWLFNFKSYWEWNSISQRRKRFVQSSFCYIKATFSLSFFVSDIIILYAYFTWNNTLSSCPHLHLTIRKLLTGIVLGQFYRLILDKVGAFAYW